MLISVVIPVYNGEVAITSAIESVFRQTYTSFEVILVDDGSTDNTGAIVKKYFEPYPNFRYIYQENQGVTKARETGVRHAKGEWILFLDADDTLPMSVLEDLVAAITPDHEIIVADVLSKTPAKIYTPDEYRKGLLTGNVQCTPVGKLFSRHLFDDWTFDIPRSIVYGEDLLMNLRIAFNINKPVKKISKTAYNYSRRPSSVSHTFKKTLEYEDLFSTYRWVSIPDQYKDQFEIPCLKNRINAWRGLCFFKFNISAESESAFYKNIIRDIDRLSYKPTVSETLQLNTTNPVIRTLAIGYNIFSVLFYRCGLVLNSLKRPQS